MGCDASFFAFDRQPDLGGLERVSWLNAYRLFRRRGRTEWYLEGPSDSGDTITFAERLLVDHAKLNSLEETTRGIRKLQQELTRASIGDAGYDDEGLLQALALSAALEQRLLYVSGNDETVDCGFICDKGKILSGRLALGATGVAVINEGELSVGPFVAAGAELGRSETRALYAIASQEAARFFGAPTPWSISSYPGDFDADDYELVRSKGTRPLRERDAMDELDDVCSSAMTPGEKLRQYVAIMAPYVDAILRKEMILADRKSRDPLEHQLGRCLSFAASPFRHHPPQMKMFLEFLENASKYVLLLRPKPKFRQNKNFNAMNDYLKWRWLRLKVIIAVRSRLPL